MKADGKVTPVMNIHPSGVYKSRIQGGYIHGITAINFAQTVVFLGLTEAK
jgi:hypothetical protein